MRNQQKNKRRDEGIALVVVLAFLGILLALAAALLIMTRTELLVSGMSKDSAVAEQLLHSAIAAAVDEIDMALWPSNNIHIPKNLAIMLNGTKNCGTNANLLKGSVTNWIPRQYLKNLDADFNGTGKQCNWTAIKATNSQGELSIVGRYSFMSFDCTGLLDANLVSQNDPPNPDYMGRMEGLSIGEIDIQYLPELGTASKREEFRNYRDVKYYRFDAFPEIHAVVSNKMADTDMTPYSHCYDRGWFDWSGGLKWRKPGELSSAIVKGDVRAWTQADALTAFTDAGYGALANQMALCFEDYVDEDFVPKSTDIPCCEPVPMINEIAVSHGLQLVNDMELTYFATVEVELWYPFVGTTNTKQYQVVIANTIAFNNDSPIQGRAGSASPYITFVMAKDPDPFDNTPCVPDPVVMADQGRSPQFVTNSKVFNFTFDFPAPLVASDFPIEVRPRGVANFDITVQEAGGVVDHAVISKRISLPSVILTAPGTTPASAKWALAANDPRLNHLMDFPGGEPNWDTPVVTLGQPNTTLGNYNKTVSGDLEGTNMYVRNSTNLASVAELGYIPTGERWGTVDLFDDKGKVLLAKYRTINTLTNICHTNGFINPNTHFTNVLFSAFINAPIDLYPDGPIQSVVDQFMARDIVSGMIEVSSDPGVKGEDSFDSPAGWVDNPAFAAKGWLSTEYASAPYFVDNNKKEAIIRNSYRLFNPNQILHVLIVAVQSINENDKGTVGVWDESEDVVMGEKRAVALLWRDPFPNENGRNEWFIRQFKYLDD